MALPTFNEWRDNKVRPAPIVEVVVDEKIKWLNEATEAQLTAIKGIGPKTARKIIELRPIPTFQVLIQTKIAPRIVAALGG